MERSFRTSTILVFLSFVFFFLKRLIFFLPYKQKIFLKFQAKAPTPTLLTTTLIQLFSCGFLLSFQALLTCPCVLIQLLVFIQFCVVRAFFLWPWKERNFLVVAASAFCLLLTSFQVSLLPHLEATLHPTSLNHTVYSSLLLVIKHLPRSDCCQSASLENNSLASWDQPMSRQLFCKRVICCPGHNSSSTCAREGVEALPYKPSRPSHPAISQCNGICFVEETQY